MNARTGGPVPLTLPTGWLPEDPLPPVEADGSPSVVVLRVRALSGMPAWLYSVTGEISNAVRRRLRSEQPALDATLRAVAAEPAGLLLLPWIEYGDPKGRRPYLVSERPGSALADDLERGPLPAPVVVSALLRCIDALHVLHRYGRAHGLISPRSLHHDGDSVRLSAPLPPSLSEIVAISGGTGHEAPEVLRGGEQNAAADVFALASTAWTLLSGRLPFGAHVDQLARLVAAEPPPLLHADVPEAMESALRASLSPDPARRPDLRTLAQALQIVEGGAAPVSALAPQAPPFPSAVPVPEDNGRLDTLAPTRPVSDTGQPLGSRYLLDALIGRGATGHVWRGHTRDGNTEVAVKLLRSDLAEDPDVVTRFMRERGALMCLQHPNLVGIRDLVAEGGALAIVMDLVDGADLRTRLAAGPLPQAEAARLLSQTAAALAAVHRADFVHRDLKPENILVERNGREVRARLTDFGLARAVESAVLTRATQLVGTPAYVAPEVVAGRAPGPAVDVYALGITAYELLTGRRPFASTSTAALLRAHLDETPQRPPDIAADVWQVIAACLLKEPEQRPDAQWLADAWQRIATGQQLAPAPQPAAASASATQHPADAGASPAALAATSSVREEDEHALQSSTGIQETTSAQRPLAARHGPPPPESRSHRKMWIMIAAAVVVLGFGGGFGFVALNHPEPTKTRAAKSEPYPLRAALDSKSAIPVVSWTLPQNLVDPGTTFVLVYRVDGTHRTQISESIPPTSSKFRAAALRPGQCVIVFAYYTTKPPPSSAPAQRTCLPAAKKTPSRSTPG